MLMCPIVRSQIKFEVVKYLLENPLYQNNRHKGKKYWASLVENNIKNGTKLFKIHWHDKALKFLGSRGRPPLELPA